MKTKIILKIILIIAISGSANYSQEITLTTTAANITSSRALIDMPELTGNPFAIIVATPLGDMETLNPHPLGVWYYNNKWNIFNTDQARMPVGLKFKMQVFLKPGPNQFVHIMTPQNIRSEGSYLDHPALNNNPNADFKILQVHAPDARPYNPNRFKAKAEYNPATGKWYIANVNGEPLGRDCAYNIVITSGGTVNSNTSNSPPIPSPTMTIVTTPTPTNSSVTQPTPIVSATPPASPMIKNRSSKSIQLAFDNLNNFVEKGLPLSAALPIEDLDLAAVMMAQQISKSDENSLPILLTALQTAGFTIIDENGKVLRKPSGDGKGQGLAIYDFEAVGSLKLANRGINISLEKIAGQIVKEVPQIKASQFVELMLKDLRTQAENTENKFLRFYARLVIELGNSSAQPIDLMTASPNSVNLSVLQATLMTRRLQGDIYALKNRQTGMMKPPFFKQNLFVSALWKSENLPLFRFASYSESKDIRCNLTGDQALILDAAAIGLTAWNGSLVGGLGEATNSQGYHTTLGKIGLGLQGANAALAWAKLVASVTMLKGEIHVQKPLPLVRTLNSTPGDKRLLVARIWQEVGKKEMLNCVRPLINVATGLDFNLPTDGPLGDVAVEWHFAGDNEIRVNNPDTRNLQNFVAFKSPDGANTNPQKQVTDNLGLSKMWLVGTPKVPAVVYQKNPIKIEKKAEVLVGVTFKSSKDFIQNWIDIGGTAAGVAQSGGPSIGLIGSLAEVGYRVPWVAARATIPVTDHEPCDGQWIGTVTYTYTFTHSSQTTISPPPGGYPGAKGAGLAGGYKNLKATIYQSGTVTFKGNERLANSWAEEDTWIDESTISKAYCHGGLGGPKGPLVAANSKRSEVRYGFGESQGQVQGGISMDKDGYKISIKPLTNNGTLQSSLEQSVSGGCGSFKPTNYNNSQKWQWGSNDPIVGRGNWREDNTILSGSDTKTTSTPLSSNPPATPGLASSKTTGSITVVTTITWNLRLCEK